MSVYDEISPNLKEAIFGIWNLYIKRTNELGAEQGVEINIEAVNSISNIDRVFWIVQEDVKEIWIEHYPQAYSELMRLNKIFYSHNVNEAISHHCFLVV
jgi:hypothetical protein